jgi:hypothetical protein
VRRVAACVGAIVIAIGGATAAPRKVLVLPLEGNADPAVRAQLASDVRELARAEAGQVTTGDATLAETAAAVGCDATKPACIDQVIATLGIDELVWGTATTTNGATQVTIQRATRGSAPRTATAVLAPGDTADKAKATVGPLFGKPAAPSEGSGSSAPIADTGSAAPHEARRDRNVGIGFVAGGGAVFLLGVALWAQESNLQGQINTAPTRTPADIQALISLENRAGAFALGGDILVLLGLAGGAVGGYYLWRDHKRVRATIAPAPMDHGAAVVVGGMW